jgi:hypothetical protein
MAKSKNGGTRAYLKGRIGSDVYSIGKDGKGNRQQVVRSLAEQVSNPRSESQMFGRMIMSTVMQAVSQLSPIIDHSFDGIAKGQPSISEFIRRNYQLVKADALANPSASNAFGLVKYQEKGAKQGAYVVSDGKALVPAAAVLTAASGILTLSAEAGTLTVATLKEALNFGSEDFITIVGIDATGEAKYARLSISKTIADSTVITDANVNDVIVIDGNEVPTLAVSGASIVATLAAVAGNCGVIVSFKSTNGYIHSACTLSTPAAPIYTSDIALPTYPVGSQLYLNGGNLAGGDRSAQIVVTPQTFNNRDNTLHVSLIRVEQKSGWVAGIDADGKEYALQNTDDDSTGFGKILTNMQGNNLVNAWANNLPEGVEPEATLSISDYMDGQELGTAQINWLINQGISYGAFFVQG